MICLKVNRNGEETLVVGGENARFISVSVSVVPDIDSDSTLHATAEIRESPELRVAKQWFETMQTVAIGEFVSIEVIESEFADEGRPIGKFGRDTKGKKVELHCSWCGKNKSEVKKLIVGPEMYICNECIGVCNEILNDEAEQS